METNHAAGSLTSTWRPSAARQRRAARLACLGEGAAGTNCPDTQCGKRGLVHARAALLSRLALAALLLAALPNLHGQTNGTVRFASRSLFAAEGFSGPRIGLIRSGGAASASVTVQVTGGTATEGVDFTISPKTVGFAPGVTNVGINLAVVADGMEEWPDTIELRLTNATDGLALDWPGQCTITLEDYGSSFEFVGYGTNVLTQYEEYSPCTLYVYRGGNLDTNASVDYQTEPITAQSGMDYTAVSGTLQFGPGEGSKSLSVPIVNNNLFDGPRTFRVRLSNPSPGSVLRRCSQFTIRIENDDGFIVRVHRPPWWEETGDPVRIWEDAGDAPVDVVIQGVPPTQPVSVDYRTEAWSVPWYGDAAIPGMDYTAVAGTLTFNMGETSKPVFIPILNDNSEQKAYMRTFKFTLLNPSAGVPLGRTPELRIGIIDNERGYSVMTDPNTGVLSFDEKAGSVRINVFRVGDYDLTTSVHYRVATTSYSGQPGSATAGLDFVPTEGTLTFGRGETNQSFTLTILDDSLSEGDEDFYIVLDQPKGTGSPDRWFETSVTIRDDEPPREKTDLARVDPDFKPDWPMPYAAVQPGDGKILLVTPAERVTGEDGLLVLRLLADGNLDPTWRAPIIDGAVTVVLPQTNGQVLVAAKPPDPVTDYSGTEFHVNGISRHHLARLNADGSLDTSFYALIMIDGAVTAMAVQPDGKILTGLSDVGGVEPTVLFRLNPEGSLDASFKQCVLWESFIWYPVKEVFLASDGGIFVCTDYGFPLVRLNPDGSRDDSFPAESSLRDNILSFAMQPDGRLLVQYRTNDSNGVVLFARLTLDGHFDPSFTPVLLGDIGAGRMFAASDGKLWIRTGGPWRSSWLRRRNADGSEDTTWLPARLEMVWPGTGSSDKILTLPDGNLLLPTYDSIMVNGHRRRGLTRLLVSAPLPRFEVDPASAIVPENGGKVPIKLVRCGTNTEPITIAWQTEGGTAKPGVDYVPASGSLSFATNESVATLELELIDNAVPDEDRTVRLCLQGPPPDRHEYPVVEFTIANADLGFPPGGIKRFPNGRVLLRTTGHPIPSATAPWGPLAYIETSEDLRHWNYADLGGGYAWIAFLTPEKIDKSAPTKAARFYRLLRWPP